MSLKVCIDCGDLAEGTRCPDCQATRDQRVDQQKGPAWARGYDRKWAAQSARVRREQPTCEVCGTDVDLTTDHVLAKANGGTDERDNLTTLCRSHNSSKGKR